MGTLSNTIEPVHGARTWAMPFLLLIVGMSLGMTIALPSPAPAAEGHWWGSPVNPGFDRNTVIQATGTALQVDIAARSGPCTLSLKTPAGPSPSSWDRAGSSPSSARTFKTGILWWWKGRR